MYDDGTGLEYDATPADSRELHSIEVGQPGVENRTDVLYRSDDSIQVRQRRHEVGEDVPCRASDLTDLATAARRS